jgi:MarR family transcriptional regulator for hemolysin
MKALPPPLRGQVERATRFMFTRIIRSLARTLHGEELSVAQLASLHLIDADGDLRQAQLGEDLLMTASSTSRMIDGLVDRGLVERRESAHDRRARTLHLTERGRALLGEIGEARVDLFEKIMRRVPRSVINLLIVNLARVRADGEV